MMPTTPKTCEPFTGEFTGQLPTYTSLGKLRYVFTKPYPRITKGQRYMVVIAGSRITLLPLLFPVTRGWR